VSDGAVHPLVIAARKHLGDLEEPTGSNWHSDPQSTVRRSLAIVRLSAPAAWCAGFVSLCVHEAFGGFPDWFQPSAGALTLMERNRQHYINKRLVPIPGCVAVYDHGGGKGHVAIVSGVTETASGRYGYHEIGGNTAPDGSRQGTGVFEVARGDADPHLLCFLRLPATRNAEQTS
jgi:CHAP domain-containing protein